MSSVLNSGGYPYPTPFVEKAAAPRCMMPNEVYNINSYSECQLLMNQCANAAQAQGALRNDPRYQEYANFFQAFGTQDRSVREVNQDGEGSAKMWMGCKLLYPTSGTTGGIGAGRPDSYNGYNDDIPARREMWAVARENLRDQLFRYHTNQNSLWGGNNYAPFVECQFRPSGSPRHRNGYQCF
jgi:hypothetical protein